MSLLRGTPALLGLLPAGLLSSLPGFLAGCTGAGQRLDHPTLLAAMGMYDVQRDVLILRFVNGMRIAQVAQMLHKSENAIKANQRRALIALRKILTEWEVADVKDG